jgi:surface antigen Omp85-like protein
MIKDEAKQSLVVMSQWYERARKRGRLVSTSMPLALLLIALWISAGSAFARTQTSSEQASKPEAKSENGQKEKPVDSDSTDGSAANKVDSSTSAQAEKQKPSQSSTATTDPNKAQTSGKADEGKGEWLLAPIPINSPAIGAGLEYAVGYLFHFNKEDKASPPSMVGIGGLFTSNGSRATAVGGRLYLKEDKYRIAIGGGHAAINFDLYGVGKLAGDRGLFIPLNVKGSGFINETLVQIHKGFYVGFRFQWRDLRLSINHNSDENVPPDIEVNPPPAIADIIQDIRDNLFRQKTVSLGPRFTWDTRDNTFYPRRGVFMDVTSDFFAEGLGSKFTYQYYKIAFNKYISLRENQVLAFRGVGCAAAGDRVPVYDLCLFGAMNDIRGYSAGRYQDRRMFATQGEYRLTLPKTGFLGRFGGVVFGGVGAVAPKFGDMAINEWLPAGGGGLRFRLTKKNPINFRVDYGVGKHGGTLIVGVGEAF